MENNSNNQDIPPQAPKKLMRSTQNKMIFGICGGIAEHLNWDPTLVRVLAVIFAIMGGGVLAYIILYFIMPQDNL
ncbi:MAG: PspC domain-containing protein [Defluviitaleaceae bacterium]|nr:PspC domain-containing protein [Defluviitaleaceae bacterium]